MAKQWEFIKKFYIWLVAGKQWYWYESWVNYVREYCKANAEKLCSKNKGETL